MKTHLLALAAVVLVVVGACSPTTISIAPGVSPRMSPDRVSSLVLGRIHDMEMMVGHVLRPARIVSMTATSGRDVALLEPDAGVEQAAQGAVVWLVRAEGTFTTNRLPPGGKPPVSPSGYYVIADADGSVLGFGFP